MESGLTWNVGYLAELEVKSCSWLVKNIPVPSCTLHWSLWLPFESYLVFAIDKGPIQGLCISCNFVSNCLFQLLPFVFLLDLFERFLEEHTLLAAHSLGNVIAIQVQLVCACIGAVLLPWTCTFPLFGWVICLALPILLLRLQCLAEMICFHLVCLGIFGRHADWTPYWLGSFEWKVAFYAIWLFGVDVEYLLKTWVAVPI